MPTIVEAIHEGARALDAAGVEDARLECELLLADSLQLDRAHVLARLGEPLEAAARGAFEARLKRRRAREPLAYIIGYCEFYGLRIACAPGALIPRPESEMLVDLVLDELREREPRQFVADVGTGTGAIAVAIGTHAPDARIVATDCLAPALRIAKRNATGHAATIEFLQADLVAPLRDADIVVANLPYVSEAEYECLAPEIRNFEPREALVPGPRGVEAVARLLAQPPGHVRPGGVLAAEIGATQGEELVRIARTRFPDAETCVMKDFAGLDRVLVVRT